MPRITRKRAGGGLLVILSLFALIVPFIFHAPTSGVKPPGGGGTTPPSPVIGAGDFSLTLSMGSLTLQPGQSQPSKIILESQNGFHDSVSVSSSGDLGLTVSQDMSQVQLSPDGSANVTLTIRVESTTSPGPYSVRVKGESGSLSHSASLAVEVRAPSAGDTQAPRTTISVRGPVHFQRMGVPYFWPNFTITLHAMDDMNLSRIVFNDNGTVTTWNVMGKAANVSLTVTVMGLHSLQYYSVDQARNKEDASRNRIQAGVDRPKVSDLVQLIIRSNIDNSGIINALLAKVETAQDQADLGHDLNGLSALVNQITAMTDKHSLDQETADNLLATIAAIQ